MDNEIKGATTRSREKRIDSVRDRAEVHLTLRREGSSSANTHIHAHTYSANRQRQ